MSEAAQTWQTWSFILYALFLRHSKCIDVYSFQCRTRVTQEHLWIYIWMPWYKWSEVEPPWISFWYLFEREGFVGLPVHEKTEGWLHHWRIARQQTYGWHKVNHSPKDEHTKWNVPSETDVFEVPQNMLDLFIQFWLNLIQSHPFLVRNGRNLQSWFRCYRLHRYLRIASQNCKPAGQRFPKIPRSQARVV